MNAGNSAEVPSDSNYGWITIVYSAPAAGFALTIIIVVILFVLCCHCRRYYRKKTSIKSLHPPVTYKKPDHIYEEIDHDTQPKPQMLGTKKNEAYYCTVH